MSKNAEFVTVVSVGSENNATSRYPSSPKEDKSAYVTVLTVGQTEPPPETIVEEVLVYRLPGERLGFGLKFEGGTKAAEFVKHLFIQSCAPNSPASRVSSSWGKLGEGDEVLQIDSLPVNSMTRTDCVRCLKDSNVVIKLLVKHGRNAPMNGTSIHAENLPLVPSTEEKHIPQPPPVPPRKIPRKLYKKNISNNNDHLSEESKTIDVCSQITPVKNNCIDVNGKKYKNCFQSSCNGKKCGQSHNGIDQQPSRDRHVADLIATPPDPEVYTDLFLHESTCSLSESDDTGSTISTIVDRLCSSNANSLPSTPIIGRHLDLQRINSYETDGNDVETHNFDDYLSVKTYPLKINSVYGQNHEKLTSSQSKNGLLQFPTYFQDAPLSYGDEKVDTCKSDNNNKSIHDGDIEIQNVISAENSFTNLNTAPQCPPSVPPRTKNQVIAPSLKSNSTSLADEVVDLPRLVDFVPKCNVTLRSNNHFGFEQNITNTITDITKLFLENEKRVSDNRFVHLDNGYVPEMIPDIDNNFYCEEMGHHNFSWKYSSLATIGEDDEEYRDYLLNNM